MSNDLIGLIIFLVVCGIPICTVCIIELIKTFKE